MCPLKLPFPTLIPTLTLCLFTSLLVAQDADTRPNSAYRRHDDPQWLIVRGHLPDPATASPRILEEQADLLRIRRFPEDALEYYGYAVRRGGTTTALMNKIGLAQLELRNVVLAEGCFRQAIKLDRRDARGWNNLAATEYLQREYGSAVGDYKRAVKLDKESAVYHANLGTAYFELKDYKKARHEADDALKLDPLIFQHSSGAGVAAHPLAVEDRARYSFEMAKLYAQHGQEEEMLHSLAAACENGFDVMAGMSKDPALARYKADPRVALLVMTAKSLRGGTMPVVASAAVPKVDGAQQAH